MSDVIPFNSKTGFFPREQAYQKRLDDLYGEWLAVRSRTWLAPQGHTLDDELKDHRRREELQVLMAATPAVTASGMARKAEVCQCLLEALPVPADVERPDLILLASIKADLRRIFGD